MKNTHLILLVAMVVLMSEIASGSLYDRTQSALTEITTSVSPDERYVMRVCQVGESGFPFGPGTCRLILTEGGKTVCQTDVTLYNDGKNPEPEQFVAVWTEDQVSVTVSAEEMEDLTVVLFFDGHLQSSPASSGSDGA